MATKTAKRKWTVLVYLAGDNNLDSAGLTDLGEMKEVGSGDKIAIVAQFDRVGGRGETKRFFLRKGTRLADDVVASLGETDTGDPDVLEKFLRWGAKTYPADDYLVVIWNHGAGWDDNNIYRSARRSLKRRFVYKGANVVRGTPESSRPLPIANVRAVTQRPIRRALFRSTIHAAVQTRAIAFDDNAKDFLDNQELKRVLDRAAKFVDGEFAVIGMDACLMSMVEVAYQLRGSAKVMVASEQTEPEEGWPYATVLRALAAKPTMTAAALGKVVVARYLASYGVRSGVTEAALDLSRAKALAQKVDKLASTLIPNLTDAKVLMALVRSRKSVQSYDTADYIDLVHFCRLVKKLTANPSIGQACDDVEVQGVRPFVLAAGFKGSTMANSHGVSIYFPTGKVSDLYANLDFAKDTRWPAFLKKYLAALTA